MGYQFYFINETKKQVVSSKKLWGDFEDKYQLLCYLSACVDDTIKIIGESNIFIEEMENGTHNDFNIINLYEYKIDPNNDDDSEKYRLLEDIIKFDNTPISIISKKELDVEFKTSLE